MDWNLNRILSVFSGLVAVFGTTYLGLSEIWQFSHGQQIADSCAIIVSAVSMILATNTLNNLRESGGEKHEL